MRIKSARALAAGELGSAAGAVRELEQAPDATPTTSKTASDSRRVLFIEASYHRGRRSNVFRPDRQSAMRTQHQYAATTPMTYSAGVRARPSTRREIGKRTTAQATSTVISWPISTPRLNVSSATGR